MRWAKRSCDAFDQGGALDEDLRRTSAEALTEIGFDGYAIGGLAMGEGQEAMFATLDFRPASCVLPTRSGRNGQAFTWNGPLNMRNARHAEDTGPVDERCACPTCSTYSRAYLHHLIKAGEMLGAILLTEHNIWFYQQLMQGMRDAIAGQRFTAFASDFRRDYFR